MATYKKYIVDQDLLSQNLNEEDVFEYYYPSFNDLADVGTKGIYLNNYFRWDPKWQHEKMIKLYDYKTSDLTRTFDTYDYNHCCNYMDIHDYIKLCICYIFIKFP